MKPPEIPDDDHDFSPELARKIICKYQELLQLKHEEAERIGRNRDMWKVQCERQADQLRAFTSAMPSQQGQTE